MRYCTSKRTGRMPRKMSRSKRLWCSPALAAFLHMMTGPSWQWSPTRTICLAPIMTGMRHSGSVDCVDSSQSTCLKRKFASLGSPAPTQVVQMTSAACRSSRSVEFWSCLNFFSSPCESSPSSSCRARSFCSSWWSGVSRWRTWWCSVRKSTLLATASRLLALRRTTLRPVLCSFSASWSTAMLEGAHTSTWPWFCLVRW
mmetsp:Transcript_88570/g.286800  ORF Transcript_88570/g.286800 Transcript_88570/m.286800 type:complete len:200 (-) Transcript_88570:1214-1813(-)